MNKLLELIRNLLACICRKLDGTPVQTEEFAAEVSSHLIPLGSLVGKRIRAIAVYLEPGELVVIQESDSVTAAGTPIAFDNSTYSRKLVTFEFPTNFPYLITADTHLHHSIEGEAAYLWYSD